MSRLVSRDPFAREELHSEVRSKKGNSAGSCDWCGRSNVDAAMRTYWTETDGGRKIPHKGQFCSVGCFQNYRV